MTKTNFTKYLPVEGEIEVGDKYTTYPDYHTIRICTDTSYDFGKCQKVKLFLCSRDIQVGDTFYDANELTIEPIHEVESEFHLKRLKSNGEPYFKIIGEISEDALEYVKEGDEFDDNQVNFAIEIHESFGETYWTGVTEEQWLELTPYETKFESNEVCDKIIQIKGPCGHFH